MTEAEEVISNLLVLANPWISKKLYAESIGVSEGVIETWMRRWTNGEEYKVIGRQTLIHRERANTWIGQLESGREEGGLKSPSGKAASASITRSSRATPITRLTSPVQ